MRMPTRPWKTLARAALAACLLLVGLGVLVGCGGDPKVLTIVYWQAPSVAGPYQSGGYKDRDAGAITLEPLAHYDPDGVLIPALAEEIPTLENGGLSADSLSISWKLKDGLKWSDGSEMTAEDVVFTWRYCIDEGTGCTAKDVFAGIRAVEALDSRTVKISFEAATPYPYQAFVSAGAPIISRTQFADCVGEAARDCREEHLAPLGTGPYRIVSFTPEAEVRYERNPHYRGEKPYFDEVVLTGGGNAEDAARALLERGEADYAWNLQVEPSLLADLEAMGHGTVVTAFADLVERVVLNQTNPDPSLGDDRSEYLDGRNPHPFLSFQPVRQAMSMAIDRTRIAALYGFAGRPECDLVAGPPRYRSGANDVCLAQDIDGAKQLLDEQGVLDTDGDGVREHQGVPLRVTFMTSTNTIRQLTQGLIAHWWREFGIETELLDFDAGVYFGGDPIDDAEQTYRRFFADVQMYTTGSGIEPQIALADLLCGQIATRENLWGGGNIARACMPSYDAAYEPLPQLPLGPERQALVKQLNDMLVQSYVQIPLVSRGVVSAHAGTLKGIRFNAWDSEMWNIGEWRR
ncbi:MAG: peptide ABC transporter substrate-binding protein [Chloroflexi bacterium]|nr:peptide ABC transporter substrate-binding protein [Chloroflexota bacterium]